MTRTLRQCPITGKPLPAPPPLPDEFQEEVTVADRSIPSTKELMAELSLHAEHGQGHAGDDDRSFHRRVL